MENMIMRQHESTGGQSVQRKVLEKNLEERFSGEKILETRISRKESREKSKKFGIKLGTAT